MFATSARTWALMSVGRNDWADFCRNDFLKGITFHCLPRKEPDKLSFRPGHTHRRRPSLVKVSIDLGLISELHW